MAESAFCLRRIFSNDQIYTIANPTGGFVAGGGQGQGPPKFRAVAKLSKNFFLSENVRPKLLNVGWKPEFLENLRAKLKF